MTFVRMKNNRLILDVHLQPNSKKDEIVGEQNDRLKIKIKAPAIENKANDYLIKFLSKFFRVPASSIHLLHGEHSRQKQLEILNTTSTLIEKVKSNDKN